MPEGFNNRILIIQLARTGDILMSLPVIQALKEKNPDSEITVMCRQKFSEVLMNHPSIDRLEIFDTGYFLEPVIIEDEEKSPENNLDESKDRIDNYLRTLGRFSIAIDLTFSESSSYVLNLIKARVKRGLKRDLDGYLDVQDHWSQYLYSVVQTGSLNRFHVTDIFRWIAEAQDVQIDLELPIPNKATWEINKLLELSGFESNPIISIQLGSSMEAKTWTPGGYLSLISELYNENNDYRFALLGSASEQHLARPIVNSEMGDKVINLCGKTNFSEYADIIKRSEIVVGSDSSASHLAAAVHTPALTLMLGPSKPQETAPYSNGNIVVQPAMPCIPCDFDKVCEKQLCKTAVPIEVMKEAAMTLLNGLKAEDLEQRLIDNGHVNLLSSVKVWKTEIFKKENGEFEIELLPLIKRYPSLEDCMKDIFYLTTKYRMEGLLETLPELDISGQSTADRIQNSVTGLELLYRSAGFGAKYSKALEIATMGKQDDKIIAIGNNLKEVDEIIRNLANTYPEFKGFICFYEIRRARAMGNSLLELATENRLCFQEMVQDLQIIFELISSSVESTKKKMAEVNTTENISEKVEKTLKGEADA